ncbi:uncharacterized protein LTR77_005695 [Saxophila tyrrhenica]|uniref:Tetratricopeptide repeat protein 15 n=1 Tax=Saxophila tyrrhenica TaxID=1690608 RepID=A0AAV9PCA4_9PEZI|nr:hypothetical protein LTR77_005695 [Saxophila tyrrhenica]
MATTKSPTGSTKRQSRNISHPLPRRSTRGPLDAPDDLLVSPEKAPPETPPPSVAQSKQEVPPPPQPPVQTKPTVDVDLHFLKDPSNYHQLGTEDIPSAFLDSENQPPQDTPLEDLLQHGHFRRAAGTALIQLSRCPADDAVQIFQLLYVRLACLVLFSRADLAAVEAASLTDFLARNAHGAETVTPLIPWELRILLVRLQSIAAADGGRRGIMALYALSAEVRAHVRDARSDGNDQDLGLWAGRLRDLGLRVADTLVEMGELETATRHLDTLRDTNTAELAYRKALLRLRIGDVAGAQQTLEKLNDDRKETLLALMDAANGDIPSAMDKWRSLAEQHPEDASFASNLAVGLLYTGKLTEARQALEDLAMRSPAFPGLLFNIGTIYELCSDRAPSLKTTLAERTSSNTATPSTGGWERLTFEFKL